MQSYDSLRQSQLDRKKVTFIDSVLGVGSPVTGICVIETDDRESRQSLLSAQEMQDNINAVKKEKMEGKQIQPKKR